MMRTMSALWFFGSAALLGGCATTYQMNRGEGVAAADGTAKVSHGDNGNTRIALKVQHLAHADRLAPGATTYVVWTRTGEGERAQIQSLGGLRIEKDDSGSLDTMTALHSFELMITPEISALVGQPTNKPAMMVQINDK